MRVILIGFIVFVMVVVLVGVIIFNCYVDLFVDLSWVFEVLEVVFMGFVIVCFIGMFIFLFCDGEIDWMVDGWFSWLSVF